MGRWAKWEATDTTRSNIQGLPSRSESVLCLVVQSCPTLWDPVDCSPPGFSAHGIFQARILNWGAISLLLGIFLTQLLNLHLLHLLHWQEDSLPSVIILALQMHIVKLWKTRELSLWINIKPSDSKVNLFIRILLRLYCVTLYCYITFKNMSVFI